MSLKQPVTSHSSEWLEDRWLYGVLAVLGVMAVVMTGTVFFVHRSLPSNVEVIDQATLHLKGEFIESNLGTTLQVGREATVRVIATRYAFVPHCILVPANTNVTFRITTPDVLHGVLITGTNVNLSIIPGFVSEAHSSFTKIGEYSMPCHEYCGVGHQDMWSQIRVIDIKEWPANFNQPVSCDVP